MTPPNKRLKAGGARRLWNECFFSAPQLRRTPLGGIKRPSRMVLSKRQQHLRNMKITITIVVQ